MKIDSSTIGMESARSYQASNVTVRRFAIMDYQAGLAQNGSAMNGNTLGTAANESSENTEEKSEQAASGQTTTMQEWQSRFQASTTKISLRSTSTTVNNIRQYTIRYIFDMLFAARRGRLNDWKERNGWSESSSNTLTTETGNTQNIEYTGEILNNKNLFVTNMKVLNYTQETFQMEMEETSFSTIGTVHTSDGRKITFNVNVGMSRGFQQYFKEDLQMENIKMCDPLVINLDTDVAELSDQNFYFDIDADGEKDEIAALDGKSGYLALDKNNDGVINDGRELFGTASGNGFADLAKYDEDGNGWIDESDAIWSKLKIWCKDENGQDVLYRLADKGVGAICLQNAATDFTLKGDDGHTKGAIRNTGIFLYENGNVGTVQHVDVAKYQGQA